MYVIFLLPPGIKGLLGLVFEILIIFLFPRRNKTLFI